MRNQAARGSDDAATAEGDDAVLVRAAQSDRTAFAALYERYAQRVYAYLHARTAGDDDAADLTQQVFLHALDALPHYRERGIPFAAWLFRIARNALINQQTRQPRTVAWDLVPPASEPAQEEDLERRAVREDDLATLRRLVAALDPDTRDLLVLRFTSRLTIREIAAVIGKSEAATQKRLFRAIQSLQEQYHEHA